VSDAKDTRIHNAFLALAIGAVGGAIFVFAFPRGSISTLMHEVLRLPGPGSGIALILGPLAIVFAQSAEYVCKRHGSTLLAALGFALVGVTARSAGFLGETKGMFGSLPFAGSLLTLGLILELGFLVRGKLTSLIFSLLFASLASLGILVFYWLFIFPRSGAGVVDWRDVPLMGALAFGGGFGAGLAAHLVWHGLSGLLKATGESPT